jgi:hypothetical protein
MMSAAVAGLRPFRPTRSYTNSRDVTLSLRTIRSSVSMTTRRGGTAVQQVEQDDAPLGLRNIRVLDRDGAAMPLLIRLTQSARLGRPGLILVGQRTRTLAAMSIGQVNGTAGGARAPRASTELDAQGASTYRNGGRNAGDGGGRRAPRGSGDLHTRTRPSKLRQRASWRLDARRKPSWTTLFVDRYAWR